MKKFKNPTEYCKSFINGELINFKSIDSKKIKVKSPIDGNCYGYIYSCNTNNVDNIIKNSLEAYKKWKKISWNERINIFNNVAKVFEKNKEKLAYYETLCTGIAYKQTLNDVKVAAEILKFYGALCYEYNLKGKNITINDNSYIYTRREPLGVCLGIGTWNFPILNLILKVAPAICSGNTMIYKPSELTPITSVIIAEIFLECGLPNGVLNIVNGDGETAKLFCLHDSIAKVSFTGGTLIGKKIAEMCSKSIKRVTLELGGKSSLVIFDDVKSIKSAVNGIILANFFTQGQVCSNASKVYIQNNIYEDVKNELLKSMSKIIIGNPLDKSVNFGPLISEFHFNKVQNIIKNAILQGAKCIYGGDGKFIPNDNLKNGFYIKPCILENCNESMEICIDEIFGPVITLLKFDNEEQVINKANNTKFGLAADIGKATRVAAAFNSSTIYINTYNIISPNFPFGGRNQSGYGKECGVEALDCYTDIKSIYLETDETKFLL